jgi:L-lysine 2,3-aminomutase
MEGYQFALSEAQLMIDYLKQHPEVTDILFTGGDSMFMTADQLNIYIDALLEANLPNIRTIRFGTKSLSYWPYRFTKQFDADNTLEIFKKIIRNGMHVAFMAHFNHAIELSTTEVKEAIERVRSTGAEIRSQSPVMRNINDNSEVWADLWKEQIRLGIIPYYMFMARDTGAQHFFSVPIERAFSIFNNAYKKVSGVARSVRGPIMSTGPGKVQIQGISEVMGHKVFNLNFIQARNPEWVNKPFYAEYTAHATWLDELKPAFGETEFFYEKEYKQIIESVHETQV